MLSERRNVLRFFPALVASNSLPRASDFKEGEDLSEGDVGGSREEPSLPGVSTATMGEKKKKYQKPDFVFDLHKESGKVKLLTYLQS